MTYDLERFVTAQAPVYAEVLDELRRGAKASHWMWFVFPQLRGLGRSETARHFGLASLDEARAYLAHPVLGPRLRECTALVNAVEGRTLAQIFGALDAQKFGSCVTLFARASEDGGPFREALGRWCGGVEDAATLALLGDA